MSRDRRLYALAEALSEFASALNDRDQPDYVNRVWGRLRSVLDWLYQCEEGERTANPDYYGLRAASEGGQALAALIWVRGLVVHRQAEVDVTAIARVHQTLALRLGAAGTRLHAATWLEYGLMWVNRDELPAGPTERFDRDLLYDKFVAGQSVLGPLTAAVRFLDGLSASINTAHTDPTQRSNQNREGGAPESPDTRLKE